MGEEKLSILAYVGQRGKQLRFCVVWSCDSLPAGHCDFHLPRHHRRLRNFQQSNTSDRGPPFVQNTQTVPRGICDEIPLLFPTPVWRHLKRPRVEFSDRTRNDTLFSISLHSPLDKEQLNALGAISLGTKAWIAQFAVNVNLCNLVGSRVNSG